MKLLDIILEQTDLSQYEGQPIPLENDDTYIKATIVGGKLIGKLKTGVKQEILPNNPKYKTIINLLIKQQANAAAPIQAEGPIVDGVNKIGEPIKVDLGKLTAQDINRVYKYSVEYQTAYNNFRKTSNGIFCAGDVYDISSAPSDVNKIRQCGAPSFDNIVPGKLKNYSGFLFSIFFMITNPNDSRVPQLKKNLGIVG